MQKDPPKCIRKSPAAPMASMPMCGTESKQVTTDPQSLVQI
jgi:hypothetical protein